MRARPRAASLILLAATALPAGAQVQEQTLVGAGIEPGDFFGFSLATDGDLAAVHSRTDAIPGAALGTVHVYELEGGTWRGVGRVVPPPGLTQGIFGTNIDLDGEHMIVGAYRHTGLSGPAFLYRRQGKTWKLLQTLDAQDKQKFDVFSFDVAIDGDVAAVGRSKDSTVFFEAGSVYVFEPTPPGSRWRRTAKLVASDAAEADRFGNKVHVDGERILVGAWWAGPAAHGKAYLFERGPGGWTEVARFQGAGVTQFEQFGISIDLVGNRALIGAPSKGGSPGAAWVFEEQGGAWAQTAVLSATDGTNGSEFGTWVALTPGGAVIGAPKDDQAGTDAGAVYVFREDGGVWRQETKVTARDPKPGDWMGQYVAATQGGFLAAVPYADTHAPNTGAVAAFNLPDFTRSSCHGTACPCGNDDPAHGCAGSDGRGARLAASGSAGTAADDLVLHSSGLPPGALTRLVMGDGQPFATPGDGHTCVGSALRGTFRFRPREADADGSTRRGPGLVAHAAAHFPGGAISPGDTWHFQTWYADPGGPCGTGFNTSQVLSVTFAP